MSEVKKIATSESYGNALVEIGKEPEDLVVLLPPPEKFRLQALLPCSQQAVLLNRSATPSVIRT